MRTYRTLLVAGVVLWLIGLLWSSLAADTQGVPSAVEWLGQLLVVVGAAGMFMAFVMRKVIARRLRPPGMPDDTP